MCSTATFFARFKPALKLLAAFENYTRSHSRGSNRLTNTSTTSCRSRFCSVDRPRISSATENNNLNTLSSVLSTLLPGRDPAGGSREVASEGQFAENPRVYPSNGSTFLSVPVCDLAGSARRHSLAGSCATTRLRKRKTGATSRRPCRGILHRLHTLLHVEGIRFHV